MKIRNILRKMKNKTLICFKQNWRRRSISVLFASFFFNEIIRAKPMPKIRRIPPKVIRIKKL
jgi:hypothetical protein